MKKLFTLSLIFVLLSVSFLHAQTLTKELDSLTHLYNKSSNDETKIKIAIEIATCYKNENNLELAYSWLKKEIKPIKSLRFEKQTVVYQYNILTYLMTISLLIEQGKENEAKKLFQEISNINDRKIYDAVFDFISQQAKISYDESQFFKAYTYYNAARQINLFIENKENDALLMIQQAKCLIELGLTANVVGTLEQAEKILFNLSKQNLPIEKGVTVRTALADLNYTQACYYAQQGNYSEALYYLDLALIWKEFFDIGYELNLNYYEILSRIYLEYSRIYINLDRFKEASTNLEMALNYATKSKQLPTIVKAFLVLSDYYFKQNNLLLAKKYYQYVIEKSNNPALKYEAQSKLAQCYYLDKNYSEAEKLVKKLVLTQNYQTISFDNYSENLQLYYSLLFRKVRKLDTTKYNIFIDALESIYEVGKISPSKVNDAAYFTVRAQSEEYFRKVKQADQYYQKAIQTYEALGSKIDLAEIYSRYANFYSTNISKNDAYQYFKKSNHYLVEFLKNDFIYLSELNRTQIVEKIKNITNTYKAYIKNNQAQLSADIKTRALVDAYELEIIFKNLLLSSTRTFYQQAYNSNDSMVKKLILDIKGLKQQLFNEELAQKNKAKIDSIKNIINLKEISLAQRMPQFNQFKENFYVNFEKIKSSLQKNEAIVEYAVIDTTYYVAYLIHPSLDSPQFVELTSADKLKSLLKKPYTNDIQNVQFLYEQNASGLYHVVWKPIDSWLKQLSIKHVHIIPAGLLYQVSFNAISDPQNKYVCDNYNIYIHGNSASILQNEIYHINPVRAFLMGDVAYNIAARDTFWDYLPGTKLEIDKISAILEAQKIPYIKLIGKDAKESHFIELMNNEKEPFSLIHIATHGFYVPEKIMPKEEKVTNLLAFRASRNLSNLKLSSANNPLLRSGLVFSGANDVICKDSVTTSDDGLLTAAEISNIYLDKTKLVVLSACESALGDVSDNEGVFGLQRAVKQANAQNLIVSLWQIPDKETVEYMETFYNKLLATKNIYQAFNETQIFMKNKYRNAYYWGAFVLIE